MKLDDPEIPHTFCCPCVKRIEDLLHEALELLREQAYPVDCTCPGGSECVINRTRALLARVDDPHPERAR